MNRYFLLGVLMVVHVAALTGVSLVRDSKLWWDADLLGASANLLTLMGMLWVIEKKR